MRQTPFWPFLFPLALIAVTEGALNPSWIWNAFPVALGYGLLRRGRRRGFRTTPELAFIFVSCGLSIFGHLAWAFDWDRTATGSSTSALIFIFLPIYSVMLGGVAFGFARLFTRREAL